LQAWSQQTYLTEKEDSALRNALVNA